MRPRPRVHFEVPRPAAEVAAAVTEALSASPMCTGGASDACITLRIHPDQRRPWSPWLQLKLTPKGEGTELEGHMGPAPELWTAFVFIYSLGVATFLGGSMFGMVQMNLGQTPTGFYGVAAALVVLATSCSADLAGRKVGQGQMGILRGFLQRALPDAIDVERAQSPVEVEATLARG